MKEFTNKPLRIAIILAGQLRQWDITSKMFAMYNNIHPDVQYDFFLATWDDAYLGNKYDVTNCDFLTDYELVDTDIIDVNVVNHAHSRYPYLLKRVNQLKNDYQQKYGIKYDCVISTRPDIFLSLGTLYNINMLVCRESHDKISYLSPISLYNNKGIEVIKDPVEKKGVLYFPRMEDFFVVGSTESINTHADMYDDVFIHKTHSYLGYHGTPANHLVSKGLICNHIDNFAKPVKFTFVGYLNALYVSNRMSDMYKFPEGLILSDEFNEARVILNRTLFSWANTQKRWKLDYDNVMYRVKKETNELCNSHGLTTMM